MVTGVDGAEELAAVDPFTAEIVRYKLEGIANEMCTTMLRSAFSPIVKEGRDASACLFTPTWGSLRSRADPDPFGDADSGSRRNPAFLSAAHNE